MDLKLTLLGRVANRWRVRVELPPGILVRGLTVGLWGEHGRPLAPFVVAPHDIGGAWVAEISGPAELPAGTEVRCLADIEGAAPMIACLGVDRRHGLHAYLHAEKRLAVDTRPRGSTLTESETERLARAFPWLVSVGKCEPCGDELLDLLRDEFGVDIDDVDDAALKFLKE